MIYAFLVIAVIGVIVLHGIALSLDDISDTLENIFNKLEEENCDDEMEFLHDR